MPLLKVHSVNKSKVWGVWEISESVESLFEQLDLDLENDGFNEISHPKKLKEWACSRLIARHIMGEMNLKYQGIVKDEYGKPWLKNHDIHISISHKYPYVTVIVDLEKEVGIDVEPVSEKILKLAPKFMDEVEAQWANSQWWVTLVWASKEALYKLHGRKRLSFKEQLKVRNVSGDEHKGDFLGKIIDDEVSEHRLVHEDCLENVVLVYTD